MELLAQVLSCFPDIPEDNTDEEFPFEVEEVVKLEPIKLALHGPRL